MRRVAGLRRRNNNMTMTLTEQITTKLSAYRKRYGYTRTLHPTEVHPCGHGDPCNEYVCADDIPF